MINEKEVDAFNPGTNRAVVEAGCGYGCYRGEVIDGVFQGLHKGVVGTLDEANRWLSGEDIQLIRVWQGGTDDHT